MSNTFILFWNPDISSFSVANFCMLRRNFCGAMMNWSVWAHDLAHRGDRFFLVKCGTRPNGIVMSGRFGSEPYRGADWSGKGCAVYYMDLDMEFMGDPEQHILSSDILSKNIPGFDWYGGHSGRLLEEEDAIRLEMLWQVFLSKYRHHEEIDEDDEMDEDEMDEDEEMDEDALDEMEERENQDDKAEDSSIADGIEGADASEDASEDVEKGASDANDTEVAEAEAVKDIEAVSETNDSGVEDVEDDDETDDDEDDSYGDVEVDNVDDEDDEEDEEDDYYNDDILKNRALAHQKYRMIDVPQREGIDIVNAYLCAKHGSACEICGYDYRKLFGDQENYNEYFYIGDLGCRDCDEIERNYHCLCLNCIFLIDNCMDMDRAKAFEKYRSLAMPYAQKLQLMDRFMDNYKSLKSFLSEAKTSKLNQKVDHLLEKVADKSDVLMHGYDKYRAFMDFLKNKKNKS